MTQFLTLDPGKWVLAWALWDDHAPSVGPPPAAMLVRVGLSRVPEAPSWKPEGGLGAIAMAHALQIPGRNVPKVVVEEMVHYPGQSARTANAKAADLLELQAIGGVVAGALGGQGCRVQFVRAGFWKGSVPKRVTQARVKATLTPMEAVPLAAALASNPPGLHHNLYDVVGIGLWVGGRMKGATSPGGAP